MTYKDVLARRGYKAPYQPELTMKRGGDVVITSMGAKVVAGRKGAFAGRKPELV